MKKNNIKKIIFIMMISSLSILYKEILSSSTPSNIILAQEFVASKEILNNLKNILNPMQPPKGTGTQLNQATQAFKQKIVQSLSKFLQLIETPDFTAFLKERDKVRQSALNDQALLGGFSNIYANHTSTVDMINKEWEQIKTALQSIISYEMLVTTLGENSEIKLKERLAPLLNIILKIIL